MPPRALLCSLPSSTLHAIQCEGRMAVFLHWLLHLCKLQFLALVRMGERIREKTWFLVIVMLVASGLGRISKQTFPPRFITVISLRFSTKTFQSYSSESNNVSFIGCFQHSGSQLPPSVGVIHPTRQGSWAMSL